MNKRTSYFHQIMKFLLEAGQLLSTERTEKNLKCQSLDTLSTKLLFSKKPHLKTGVKDRVELP